MIARLINGIGTGMLNVIVPVWVGNLHQPAANDNLC